MGEVKRLYIESNGTFTLLKNNNPTEGLSCIPVWDHEMRDGQNIAKVKVCATCGKKKKEHEQKCSNCFNENEEMGVI